MGLLEGKVVLVNGGSRGVGAGIVRADLSDPAQARNSAVRTPRGHRHRLSRGSVAAGVDGVVIAAATAAHPPAYAAVSCGIFRDRGGYDFDIVRWVTAPRGG